MPAISLPDTHTGITADILRQLRRRQNAAAASQALIWEFDTFTITGAGDTTHTLSWVPYGVNVALLNGLGMVEGTNYTVDYTTGILTVSSTLTAGDVLHVRYVTTGELKVYSTPADTGHLAYDTFTRANSSTLGDTEGGGFTWTPNSGTNWTITSNTLHGAMAVNDTNALLTINAGVADITMAADFTTLGSVRVSGLAFRASDTSNYFRIAADGRLWKRVAGAETTLMTSSLIPAGATVQVVTSGSSISYYVNGVQRGTTVTDTFNQTATKHGFFASDETVTFDNFTLDSP